MRLVLGDITKMDTDAIVNAASSDLRPCPGICSAIFAAADTEKLLAACKKIGRCRIGKAVITPSFGLACKYIIHVAGIGCYRSALQKAAAYHCKSVAVPLMFSGDFHIPRAQALQIAADVIAGFEKSHPSLEISLVIYKQSIYDLAKKIISNAQE